MHTSEINQTEITCFPYRDKSRNGLIANLSATYSTTNNKLPLSGLIFLTTSSVFRDALFLNLNLNLKNCKDRQRQKYQRE